MSRVTQLAAELNPQLPQDVLLFAASVLEQHSCDEGLDGLLPWSVTAKCKLPAKSVVKIRSENRSPLAARRQNSSTHQQPVGTQQFQL